MFDLRLESSSNRGTGCSRRCFLPLPVVLAGMASVWSTPLFLSALYICMWMSLGMFTFAAERRLARQFRRRVLNFLTSRRLCIEDQYRRYVLKGNSRNTATSIPAEIQLHVFGLVRNCSTYDLIAELVISRDLHAPATMHQQNARLRSIKDLRSCAMTCRAWNACASRLLLEHLTLRTPKDAHNLATYALYSAQSHMQLASVTQLDLPNHHPEFTPAIHKLLRRVDFKLHKRLGALQLLSPNWTTAPFLFTEAIHPIIRACINLRVLTIWTHDTQHLSSQLRALRDCVPSTLAELRLRVYRHYTDRSDVDTSLFELFADKRRGRSTWVDRLTHLHLDGVGLRTRAICGTPTNVQGITSLSLRRCHFKITHFGQLLDSLPNLTSVSLIDTSIDTLGSGEMDLLGTLGTVAKQLHHLVAVGVEFLSSSAEPESLIGFNNLRSFTFNPNERLGPPITATVPASLRKLVVVFRPRHPRAGVLSVFNELYTFLRECIAVAIQRAHELDEVVVWDYLAQDTEHESLVAALLTRRHFKRVCPQLCIQFNFIRLPYVLLIEIPSKLLTTWQRFTENQLANLGTYNELRNANTATKRPVGRWLERQGILPNEIAPLSFF